VIVRKQVGVRGYLTREDGERQLEAAGVDPAMGEWNFGLGIHGWIGAFEISDNRWRVLQELAERAGMATLRTERVEYTEAEVRSAELLYFRMTATAKGVTSPDFGDTYDFSNACPSCLSGARLVGPLHIAPGDLPKKHPVAKTYLDELLIRADVADRLVEEGVEMEDLAEVVAQKTEKPLPWRHLRPRVTLPKLHPRTQFEQERPCPRCKRDGFAFRFEPYLVLHYSRAAILETCGGLPDLAGTWERWAPGTRPKSVRRQVAQPDLVMSQRYARSFADALGKWIVLEPVVLLD
jgi:hypothetical protein